MSARKIYTGDNLKTSQLEYKLERDPRERSETKPVDGYTKHTVLHAKMGKECRIVVSYFTEHHSRVQESGTILLCMDLD